MSFKLKDGDRLSVDRSWDEGSKIFSQCVSCKWNFMGRAGCAAFPDGRVPMKILLNRFDHKNPYDGDGGVQYEMRSDWNYEVDTTSRM